MKLHPYSKSISTTKCVISTLFKINIHHQMWNRAPTPNRYASPPRTWTRGLQHENWVCRPLHPKKQDKIQPLLQSTLRLFIHSSHNGLNYLGRIIACCSMRIVSRTGGVVVNFFSKEILLSLQDLHFHQVMGIMLQKQVIYWDFSICRITTLDPCHRRHE